MMAYLYGAHLADWIALAAVYSCAIVFELCARSVTRETMARRARVRRIARVANGEL